MDPIEIFELYGYVVQASSTNPEFAVNTTEMRGYVVQQARARDVLFATEVRAYMIDTGAPKTGVAVNKITGYIIGHDEQTTHLHGENSSRAGLGYRRPGVFVADITATAIEPDPNSSALKSGMTNRDPGLIHMATTVYTIEVP